ncbi:hypothetical protein [Alkalihalobacillus sp. BA299]|uniref:hypothetical protein n=1 Tax=Alkalihalobacillus sp. BA299 TaxID=2815938 RepID=UPI001ADCBC10|nr:hypothetical protein [Alkalihalobacillus sp. BA299]
MLDKSLTIRTVNDVLKEVIIPNINNSMAKEQAIAIISVLKNVDMHSVQNVGPKKQLVEHIQETLNEMILKIINDKLSSRMESIVGQFKDELIKIERFDDVTEKCNRLNELQCNLIRSLYEESTYNTEVEKLYILPLRKKFREQLMIEMALVR